ncbi:MAG TPA: hypothetical protein VL742_15130 [Casimicrobiaceae bacterium]|nr:hypothetical protein [Casimicrobiaceae bacterium]
MTLDARVRALLDLVEADRSRRSEAILGAAQARAAETLAAARVAAREGLHAAFREERERREARVAAAQARLQTHRRLHEQRRAGALLSFAWARLPDALVRRWLEAPSRQAWVARVLHEARAVLLPGRWRIEHARLWPPEERDSLGADLCRALGTPPEFVENDAIRAGLRISAGGNVIDGTLAGLIGDRVEIGARLLRHMEEA